MQRSVRLVVLTILAAVIAACSPASPPTTSATTEPSAKPTAGALFSSPSAEATPSAEPTATPTIAPTSAPIVKNQIILWHPYAENSPDEQALLALIERARPAINLPINVRRIEGDVATKFEVEATAGGGPDLLLAPNDQLGREVRAGLLRGLDSELATITTTYAANALDALRVDGKLYGVPLARSSVALYYNKQKLGAPQSTQGLLDAVKGGAKAVFVRSVYHNFGFFGSFGGKLLDNNGRCIADQGGFADGMAYLRDLKAAGAEFVTSGAEAETRFKDGQADLTINGSWLRGDFRAAIGDALGSAPLPNGPAGPATPLIGAVGLYVNANSKQADAAIKLAAALTTADAQQQLVERTQQLPAVPNIPIADETVAGLTAAAERGVARTQRPEMDAFWQLFDAALADVLDNNADPAAAIQDACTKMNQANGK